MDVVMWEDVVRKEAEKDVVKHKMKLSHNTQSKLVNKKTRHVTYA